MNSVDYNYLIKGNSKERKGGTPRQFVRTMATQIANIALIRISYLRICDMNVENLLFIWTLYFISHSLLFSYNLLFLM